MNKQYIREKINPLLLFLYKLNDVRVYDNLLSCSQEEKRAFIKSSYQKRPDAKTFVETGTYIGDTVEYVKNDFEKIYTIELSDKYAEDAIKRFAGDQKIKVIKGDSTVELSKLLPELQGPCVFWLDGHYSYSDTAKADKETPVLEEIRPLLETKENHLILIDDARLFIGRHNYPWILTFARFVKKVNPAYNISISKDIIIVKKDNDTL